MLADDVDEEDRRPTQRRRLEDAQAGGFDENMEPLVSCCKHLSFLTSIVIHQTVLQPSERLLC